MSLTSLKRIKEPPLQGEQYSLKERSGEIRELEKQRDILAKEVKKLSEIFFRLEEGEKKVRANVEGMATERLSVISNISKQISSELEKKSNKLVEKSTQLDEKDSLLAEMFEYLYAHAQIVEAEASLNARRGVLLDKRGRDVAKSEKDTAFLLSGARKRLKNASEKARGIDGRYEKADKIAKWFENESDKEKHRLDVWAKTIKLREKKVAAEKRALKKIEKKQEDRGLWLIDREEMLSRTMAEIKMRENAIISDD